jgi:hypothetical protein
MKVGSRERFPSNRYIQEVRVTNEARSGRQSGNESRSTYRGEDRPGAEQKKSQGATQK